MLKAVNSLSREAEITFEVKRSKFVGRSFRRKTPVEAMAAVREIKSAHRDASHNVWAYRLGLSGEQARTSDDGEPQGTAGPPILQVLERREMTNTVVVVTRYFGGVKLGAGGLLRAYGDAAKLVLDASHPREIRRMAEIEAIVPHGSLALFEKRVAVEKGEILDRRFGEHVAVRLRLPAEALASFRNFHAGLVAGKSEITLLGEDFL